MIPKSSCACTPNLQPALSRKYGDESSVQVPFVRLTLRKIGGFALPVPVVR